MGEHELDDLSPLIYARSNLQRWSDQVEVRAGRAWERKNRGDICNTQLTNGRKKQNHLQGEARGVSTGKFHHIAVERRKDRPCLAVTHDHRHHRSRASSWHSRGRTRRNRMIHFHFFFSTKLHDGEDSHQSWQDHWPTRREQVPSVCQPRRAKAE